MYKGISKVVLTGLLVVLVIGVVIIPIHNHYAAKTSEDSNTSQDKNSSKKEIAGTIISGGDTTPVGVYDLPRVFIYLVRLKDGSEINVSYTAYPPRPMMPGAPTSSEPRLSSEVKAEPGVIIRAKGSYDKSTNTIKLVDGNDYIETSASK